MHKRFMNSDDVDWRLLLGQHVTAWADPWAALYRIGAIPNARW